MVYSVHVQPTACPTRRAIAAAYRFALPAAVAHWQPGCDVIASAMWLALRTARLGNSWRLFSSPALVVAEFGEYALSRVRLRGCGKLELRSSVTFQPTR